ncbi:MAG TPA: hypothetical protein PLU72_16160 [Candidatus Ozemobacteraceae bacterium]|mgnify:CR=1 FL=1|nr:hypothetical protein [Candidatus Ozemobacteraceae bacterium]
MSRNRAGLFSVFLAGAAANIGQIALLRTILGQFYGTELHLGTFLAVWLLGLAAGGRLAAALSPGPQAVVTATALAPAASLLLFMFGTATFLPESAGELLPFLPVVAVIAVTVFPVSIAVGALLPAMVKGAGSRPGAPVDRLYALESAGGAIGGGLFAFVAGGATEPIVLIWACFILSSSALCLVMNGRLRIVAGLIALLTPLASPALPAFQRIMDEYLWKRFHPGYGLVRSFDTAYQSVKISSYGGQYSLFLDNNFIMTWPDRPAAEQRVHTFFSSLPASFSFGSSTVLFVGIPAPDILEECLKYKVKNIHVVDLDDALAAFMKNLAPSDPRVRWEAADPRAFLRANPGRFDAVLVLPSDPTTLVGNRMFTREAIREAMAALTERGVVEYVVSGAENYLGGDLEKAVLSLYRDLKSSSGQTVAVPGDPIRFRASRSADAIATSPEELSRRFDRNGIQTVSFRPALFSDLLLPFRVAELEEWLSRTVPAPENTDARPAALSRQLHLWDIYSGSGIGAALRVAERIDLGRALVILGAFLALVLASVASGVVRFSPIAAASSAVALTGFFGLAAEMMLLLTYQVRHGAIFGMASLFFALYMLGLALGGFVSRRFKAAWGTVRLLKFGQLVLAGTGFLLLENPALHSLWTLGGMTLLVAVLAGVEFPLLARLSGDTAGAVAGLVVADNLPAMLAAATAGIWMLPTLGMQGSWLLLATAAGGTTLLLGMKKSE